MKPVFTIPLHPGRMVVALVICCIFGPALLLSGLTHFNPIEVLIGGAMCVAIYGAIKAVAPGRPPQGPVR
jgi:hypothetical protein